MKTILHSHIQGVLLYKIEYEFLDIFDINRWKGSLSDIACYIFVICKIKHVITQRSFAIHELIHSSGPSDSIDIQPFSFKKMHWKMLSSKSRPYCPGFNMLTARSSLACSCTDFTEIWLRVCVSNRSHVRIIKTYGFVTWGATIQCTLDNSWSFFPK